MILHILIGLLFAIMIALVIILVHLIDLLCKMEKVFKPKPIGRPRGSRNRAPAQAPTLVQQAETYFGPQDQKKPMSAEDLAELVRSVNERDKIIQDEMLDPNDEMRTGTGYAGT